MAKDLFYLASYKNVDKLFEKIEAAKAPEAFTNAVLTDTMRATRTPATIAITRFLPSSIYLVYMFAFYSSI